MDEMQIFQNEQFGTIRTVMQNDEPWFVAADLCKALDLTNTTVALERLADDEKSKFNLGLSGGETNVVNEYGMYALILGSRKPEAIQFQRWVTHEILPAIRKTGHYAAPGTMTNALAEMHSAMDLMQDLLADMKQLVPRGSSLDRALAAQAEGRLEPQHLAGRTGAARRLLDHEKIGKKITVYMIEEDLTVEEFAEQVGVDKRSVFRWKSGEYAPAGDKLTKLCELLGCEITDLLR